jgi:hypothetical protein
MFFYLRIFVPYGTMTYKSQKHKNLGKLIIFFFMEEK